MDKEPIRVARLHASGGTLYWIEFYAKRVRCVSLAWNETRFHLISTSFFASPSHAHLLETQEGLLPVTHDSLSRPRPTPECWVLIFVGDAVCQAVMFRIVIRVRKGMNMDDVGSSRPLVQPAYPLCTTHFGEHQWQTDNEETDTENFLPWSQQLTIVSQINPVRTLTSF